MITTYSYDVESNFEIFCFCGAYLGVGRQGKIPSRSILESKIWDSYYSSFARSSALREKPLYLNIIIINILIKLFFLLILFKFVIIQYVQFISNLIYQKNLQIEFDFNYLINLIK